MPGPFKSPPLTENFQQLGGEHHVAILLALTLLNANHHPSTVNVANVESNGFGDPQPRGIATGEDGTVVACSYAA